MRYEIRFYSALDHVKVTVELDAADRHAAETAARRYLLTVASAELHAQRLVLGVVKELP
jgi:hypothetical protein